MASNRPVIIKRKKVVAGGGHHGGAWKVAYADFVTAMMAFFMLMWLLNATTETQRQGIADYFSPDIPLVKVSGGGSDALGGDDILSNDIQSGSAGGRPSDPTAELAADGAGDAAADEPLERLQDLLSGDSGESELADELLEHIVTRVTDEGLIVELFDLPGARLFEPGTARPTDLMEDLLIVVRDVFAMATNGVAINGHVRTEAVVRVLRDGWDLSAARAQRVRQSLVRDGFDEGRIERIGGFADRQLVRNDPMDVRNNRLELILLR